MLSSRTQEPDEASLSWIRSSSCGGSSCVEIAVTDGAVHVRDSKNAQSPVLSYDRLEWIAFVQGVKAGEFDLLH